MKCRVVLLKLKDSNSGFKVAEVLSKDFSISKPKAYEFAKKTPFTLYEGVEQLKAEEIKAKYEACGCEIEVIPESEAAKIKSDKRKYHSKPPTVMDILAQLEANKKKGSEDEVVTTIPLYIKVGIIAVALLFILSLVLMAILFLGSRESQKPQAAVLQTRERMRGSQRLLSPSVQISNEQNRPNTFYEQLISQGKFQNAVVYLSDRIHSSAPNADYFKYLGVAYYNIAHQKGESEKWENYARNIDDFWECEYIDKSLLSFKRAVELNPNDYESLNYIGVIYAEKGWLDKAERVYREAIGKKPSYMEAQNNLAILLRNKGRFREAIEMYRAININFPNTKSALLGLGIIHLEDIRDTAMAISYLRRYVAIEPRDVNYIIVTQILNRVGR